MTFKFPPLEPMTGKEVEQFLRRRYRYAIGLNYFDFIEFLQHYGWYAELVNEGQLDQRVVAKAKSEVVKYENQTVFIWHSWQGNSRWNRSTRQSDRKRCSKSHRNSKRP